MSTKTYHQIVFTCGISLFSGHNLFRRWADGLNLFVYERTNPKPAPDSDAEKVMEGWETACRQENLSRFGAENPKNISAEYSMLHALASSDMLGPCPHVVLIHTDSLGGRAAAFLLARLIRKDFNAQVKCCEVADIDPDDRERLRRSLGGFMQTTAAALENGDPRVTCFAPVGGYKVMTSLGYLAGAYMGFPTAYLHEDNQSLHEIPPVPVRIDIKTLGRIAPLMRRLQNLGDQEWHALSVEEQAQVQDHVYLFERLDTLVGVNAFGQFLMARPEHRHLFATRVLVSAQADAPLRNSRHMAFAAQQIQEMRKKLARFERYRGELRHDATFDNLRGANFHLYKGARQGLVFSAAYRYDPQTDTLLLNRIWIGDHDAYERDAESGNGFFDNADSVEWRNRSGDFSAPETG